MDVNPYVDQYKLIKAYSIQGRSGVVWQAEDTSGELVVLKTPDFNETPNALAKQRKEISAEIEALDRLRHFSPPIVALLDKGKISHAGEYYAYLVLEKLDDVHNLYGIVKRDYENYRKLPVLEMLDIVQWMLRVLQEAHNKGIVYNDVDIKHIFWNRSLQTNLFVNERQRIRVIDWGNSFQSTDIDHQKEDILQVGELLQDIFTIHGTQSLESRHQYSSNLLRILNAITTNQFSSVSSLITKINDLRREIQQVFHRSINDIDKQISALLNDQKLLDFEMLSNFLREAEDLYREYHYCDQFFWESWNNWHMAIITKLIQEIGTEVRRSLFISSDIDKHIDLLQGQINKLTNVSESQSQDFLMRLADYMRLSIRIIQKIRETSLTGTDKDSSASIIVATWHDLLTANDGSNPEVIMREILRHTNGRDFQEWQHLALCAYLLAYVFDVEVDRYPLDVAFVRMLFNHNPSGESLNENARDLILGFHHEITSNQILQTVLQKYCVATPFDPYCNMLIKQYSDYLSSVVENLQNKTFNPHEFDYWHSDTIASTWKHVNELADQQKHVRSFCFSDEKAKYWHPTKTINDFEQWISSYRNFLSGWHDYGKDIRVLKQWVSLAEKSLRDLREALVGLNIEQAISSYTDLTDSLERLSDGGVVWLNSILPQAKLKCDSLEDITYIWNNEIAPQQNPIQDLFLKALSNEIILSAASPFQIDRKCLDEFVEIEGRLHSLINDTSTHFTVNALARNIVKNFKTLIDLQQKKEGNIYLSDVPESPFKSSAKAYLQCAILGFRLSKVSGISEAQNLDEKLTQKQSFDITNQNIFRAYEETRAILDLIVKTSEKWGQGNFIDKDQLQNLQNRVLENNVFKNSSLGQFVGTLVSSFEQANSVTSNIHQLKAELFSRLSVRTMYPELCSDETDFTNSDQNVFNDISAYYDKLIELGGILHLNTSVIQQWKLALEHYWKLHNDKTGQLQPVADNDPLKDVYVEIQKGLSKTSVKRNPRNVMLVAVLTFGIIIFLVFLFAISNFGTKTEDPTALIVMSPTENSTSAPNSTDLIDTSAVISSLETLTSFNPPTEESNINFSTSPPSIVSSLTNTSTTIPTATHTATEISTSTPTLSPAPSTTPTDTAIPSDTPFPAIDFSNEREIQSVIGALDINQRPLSPFLQPLFDHYLSRLNVIIVGGRASSNLESPNESQIRPSTNDTLREPGFENLFIPIPVHIPTVDERLGLNGIVPDFRAHATLWLGDTQLDSSYYGINAIIESVDSGNTEVNVVWILAVINDIDPRPIGDIIVATTDPYVRIPQELRDALLLRSPNFGDYEPLSPYLITYIPPLQENLSQPIILLPEEFQNRDVSQIDFGFSRTNDGKVAIVIDKQQVVVLDFLFDEIIQFTVIADYQIGLQLNALAVRTP